VNSNLLRKPLKFPIARNAAISHMIIHQGLRPLGTERLGDLTERLGLHSVRVEEDAITIKNSISIPGYLRHTLAPIEMAPEERFVTLLFASSGRFYRRYSLEHSSIPER